MTRVALGGGWSIDWDSDGWALEGQSGDLCLVAPFDGGALIATIDGLGHGSEAHEAAELVACELEKRCTQPLDQALRYCHEQARGSRGVALAVAAFDAARATLTWTGIGNVDAALFRASEPGGQRESLVPRGGVVGYVLPARIALSTVAVNAGELLVMATDGLRDFESGVDVGAEPSAVATRVLQECARGTDDALVVAVRFLEGA